MYEELAFEKGIEKIATHLHPVIMLAEGERAVPIDLSAGGVNADKIPTDIGKAVSWFEALRENNDAAYLYGGYREVRNLYNTFQLFNNQGSLRNLHLGIDVWGNPQTRVYSPWGGMVHSFKYNSNPGDYGSTIILQHQTEAINFYTLYGHLSLKSLEDIELGRFITRGVPFAQLGEIEENGGYPPHLHFQIILDMGVLEGDYPGVCALAEAHRYLQNSPNPGVFFRNFED